MNNNKREEAGWVRIEEEDAQDHPVENTAEEVRTPAPRKPFPGRQQEPNTVPEHYEIEEELADLAADALLNRSDLDQHLVCKCLPIFGRLPRETREIDGKFILRLSAGRTGSGLQVFLESAIKQNQ